MPRMLVHIGYHKTATSWLQQYLFGRRDRGFSPMAPLDCVEGKPAAKFLSGYFVRAADDRLLSPFQSRSEEVWTLLEELPRTPGAVPVMSSERLSGNPHSGGFDARLIANRIHEVFPDAKILIVIREQVGMILSMYFQYLNAGGTNSLDDYIGQGYDGRLPVFSLTNLEYHLLIEYYQNLFGPERVLTLAYEEFRENPSCFVADLANFAGATVPVELEYESVVNRGLPRFMECRTRLLNAFTVRDSINAYSPWRVPHTRAAVKWLRAVAAKVVPEATERAFVQSLQDRIETAVSQRYEESNRRTSELTGLNLAALGYADSWSHN